MQERSTLREYFYFTKKERNGILFLLLLSLVIVFLPIKKMVRQPAADLVDDSLRRQLIALAMQPEAAHVRDYTVNNREPRPGRNGFASEQNEWTTPASYFYFDPNTLDAEGWRKLGLPDKTLRTLMRYVEKGGRFRRPEDLRKIWGIPPERAERLIPYVKIAEAEKPFANSVSHVLKTARENTVRVTETLDVNLADTSAWISLPGIGSKLANRIVSFREKLGGFVWVEQVAEIYGLSDSTYQLIRKRLVCSNPNVRKLNINRASVEELKAHPYIRYPLASAIVQYRSGHGNFSRVEDLKKLVMVTPEIVAKVSPYLTVGE